MNNRILYIIGILCLLSVQAVWAQRSKLELKKANEAFRAGRYDEAKDIYAKTKGNTEVLQIAKFGQAVALYKQGKLEESAKLYKELLKSSEQMNQEQMAQVLHNLGNISMKGKKYDQAIELYQNALIANPSDEDTRYNLVLAQKLREQKNNQGGGSGRGSSSSSKGQQSQKNNQNSSGSNKSESEPSEAMTREQMERLLDAYKNEDNQVRQRAEQNINEMQRSHDQNNTKRW